MRSAPPRRSRGDEEIARLACQRRVTRRPFSGGRRASSSGINGEWFNFYNGYDPLFTWWMGVPYTKVDEALKGYATQLREKVAAENLAVPVKAASLDPIAAAPPPPSSDVPDLSEIIALPQDEMREIVERFTGAGTGRGGGRGLAAPQEPRDAAFYSRWLAALETLDFDRLSRNAQVDYLFIRRTAEDARFARANLKLIRIRPAIGRQASRGRRGGARADPGPVGAMIPSRPKS